MMYLFSICRDSLDEVSGEKKNSGEGVMGRVFSLWLKEPAMNVEDKDEGHKFNVSQTKERYCVLERAYIIEKIVCLEDKRTKDSRKFHAGMAAIGLEYLNPLFQDLICMKSKTLLSKQLSGRPLCDILARKFLIRGRQQYAYKALKPAARTQHSFQASSILKMSS